jgi:hypothetical protein
MRIYILLAAVVVVLTGVPAESFAGSPQRQVAKRSENQSAAVRPQVKKLLTNSPAYRPL